MKTLGNVEGSINCSVAAWVILESQGMTHDANLAGSSNCYTRALQRAVGVLHLSWGVKSFVRTGDCINNAAKV